MDIDYDYEDYNIGYYSYEEIYFFGVVCDTLKKGNKDYLYLFNYVYNEIVAECAGQGLNIEAIKYFLPLNHHSVLKGVALSGCYDTFIYCVERIKNFKKNKIILWNEVLISAVKGQNIKIIKYAIEKSNEKNRAMEMACLTGNINIVKLFLKEVNKYPEFALFKAIESGKIKLVKFLLEKNKYVPDCAIDFAFDSGKIAMINYVKTLRNFEDWDTTLSSACKTGNIELVKYSLRMGGDDWQLALEKCAEGGFVECFDYVLGNRGFEDLDEELIFSCAVKSGNVKMLEYLFNKGIDIRILENRYIKPIVKGQEDIMIFLDKNGLQKHDIKIDHELMLKLHKDKIRHFQAIDKLFKYAYLDKAFKKIGNYESVLCKKVIELIYSSNDN